MHYFRFGFFVSISLLFPKVQTDEPASYEGFRVYDVVVQNTSLLEYPEEVSLLNENRVFSRRKAYCACSYLVPAHREETFRNSLSKADVAYKIAVHDMGRLIQKEREGIAKTRATGDGMNSKIYLSYDELVSYLRHIRKLRNPSNNELLALVENIGYTYEGREMFGVKISSDHSRHKPIIFFEAGSHAREWTGPAAAVYMIQQLVQNFTWNQHVLRHIDFYVIPLSNPDGYEYSRIKDRLWRKTRSVHVPKHFGVDINRNFDYHWGETGSSSVPWSIVYKGPYAFSEPEARNIRDAGKKYKSRIRAFISIHSYGGYILYPWGYSKDVQPSDMCLLNTVGKHASEAMRKFGGSQYVVGQSSVLLYESAGGSDDYFKAVFKVPLSYTIELTSGDAHSFIVEPCKVHGIVSEAFQGFKAFAQSAASHNKRKKLR